MPTTTSSERRTSHFTEGRFGIGLGRVRNVTPVVRALRLDARLQALDRSGRLSDEQLQEVARQFARRPGYPAVYDRPDKHFWNDLFEQIDDQIGPLSPFETLYLTDVLQERLGQRFEGADAAIGTQTRVGTLIVPFVPIQVSPDASTEAELGAFVTGRWYKNLSLNHQLGFTGDVAAAEIVTQGGPGTGTLRTTATGTWLWSVADRFVLDTQLTAHLTAFDEGFTPLRRYTATSSLFYFVENNAAFNVTGNMRWQQDDGPLGHYTDEFRWDVSVGFSYYLDRVLR